MAVDVRNQRFLEILKAALEGKTVEADGSEDWQYFTALAMQHKVLPLLCDGMPGAVPPETKAIARRQVAMQTVKTSSFLELNRQLRQAGLSPVSVKGILCRSIYPNPDSRISADEDVLLPEEEFASGCAVLEQFGMYTEEPEDAHVRAYRMKATPLYVELHRQLFDPASEVYGSWNAYFTDARKTCEVREAYGEPVTSFLPTDHLFYLICHAFKHFLHSGFGIRQACDIAMYANAEGSRVDWQQLLDNCRQIRAHLFAAAVFQIGAKHLTFDPLRACYPAFWQDMEVDEAPLLEDLLASGIYGGITEARKRSSNMTLGAVADNKQGKKTKNAVRGALFPPVSVLKERYPYLKKQPWLLPAAWVSRILTYGKEASQNKGGSARESVEIGNQRLKLLRQYGVIS